MLYYPVCYILPKLLCVLESNVFSVATRYFALQMCINSGLFIEFSIFLYSYCIFRTIRRTQVLEEEHRKKNFALPPPRPKPNSPASQVSYIQTIKCTPIFLPNLDILQSKNTVICLPNMLILKELYERVHNYGVAYFSLYIY